MLHRDNNMSAYADVETSKTKDGEKGSANRSWTSYLLGSLFGGNTKDTTSQQNDEMNKTVVECVVRNSERRGRFTPDNVPDSNQWYWIDIMEIANYFQLDPATTLLVEAVDGFPESDKSALDDNKRTGTNKVKNRYPERRRFSSLVDVGTGVSVDGHYGYAGIWASLAVSVALMASRIKRV